MAVSLEDRARVLHAISKLPAQVFLTSLEAACYLGTTPAVLGNWRSERIGPKYSGHGPRFVRYRVSDLDQWMQGRAGEVGTPPSAISHRRSMPPISPQQAVGCATPISSAAPLLLPTRPTA